MRPDHALAGEKACIPGDPSKFTPAGSPGWDARLEYNEHDAINRARQHAQDRLDTAPMFGTPPAWTDPGPENTVLAEAFLHHLDLDKPGINAVLKEAYPYLERDEGLKASVHARVRFLAWATLKSYNTLYPAWRRLAHDLDAQHLLGFHEGVPCYDTFREFIHERLSGVLHDRLLEALLTEEHRGLPSLGTIQVEDATPVEARRREEEAPYNPHYGVRMMKLELRWDVDHEALLTQQFYDGLVHEGRWLVALTDRLHDAGVRGTRLTVDGGYPSLQNVALQWRAGQPLKYKAQEGWKIDAPAALADVQKRYQAHRHDHGFRSDAPLCAKLCFLVDHGTEHDMEAVGRYLRDDYVSTKTAQADDAVKSHRSQNEGLNAEYKRLPLAPARRGARELLRRSQACSLTLHLVQLTRIQHGVTTHLCRTAHLL